MGFPHTAIDTFLGRTPKLSWADGPSEPRDKSVFFDMMHSKGHWEEELALRRKRCEMIRKYAQNCMKVFRKDGRHKTKEPPLGGSIVGCLERIELS